MTTFSSGCSTFRRLFEIVLQPQKFQMVFIVQKIRRFNYTNKVINIFFLHSNQYKSVFSKHNSIESFHYRVAVQYTGWQNCNFIRQVDGVVCYNWVSRIFLSKFAIFAVILFFIQNLVILSSELFFLNHVYVFSYYVTT